jgi:hypothetical protein
MDTSAATTSSSSSGLFTFMYEDGALNGGINFNDIFKDDEPHSLLSLDLLCTTELSQSSDSNLLTPTNVARNNMFSMPPSMLVLDELDLHVQDTDLMQPIFDFEDRYVASTEQTQMKKKRARSQMSEAPLSPNKRFAFSSPGNESCDDSQTQTIIRGSWSTEEDNMLKALVSEMVNRVESEGAISWTMVASKMKIRSAKQCRERWILNLDPSINHEPFLPHEDAILLSACSQLGPRWTKIKTLLPGRTENSVKTRYKSLTRKSNLRVIPNLVREDSGASYFAR